MVPIHHFQQKVVGTTRNLSARLVATAANSCLHTKKSREDQSKGIGQPTCHPKATTFRFTKDRDELVSFDRFKKASSKTSEAVSLPVLLTLIVNNRKTTRSPGTDAILCRNCERFERVDKKSAQTSASCIEFFQNLDLESEDRPYKSSPSAFTTGGFYEAFNDKLAE